MANSIDIQRVQPTRSPVEILAWTMYISALPGWLVSSLILAKVVPTFADLFSGLHVELPFATRIMLTHHIWLSALFAGAAVILPTATELLVPATRRLIIAVSALAASIASVVLTLFCLYLPLIELAIKAAK
jgi:hypothetical protein